MSFSLVWAAGQLVDRLSKVLASRLSSIDTNVSRAIDGTAGGLYSPSSPIIVNSQLTIAAPDNVQLASRAITRRQTMEGHANSTNWVRRPGGIFRNVVETDTCEIYLKIPDGQTLDSVTVRYQGASGHAQDPVDDPGGISMPSIVVLRYDEDGTQTTIGSLTFDTVTSRASYEAPHDITSGSLAHTIDRGKFGDHYVVRVGAETGTDYIANGECLAVETVCTCTSYTEY